MTPRVRVYQDEAQEWRWTKWSGSDKIADSGEGYVNFQHTIKMAAGELPDGGKIIIPPDIYVDMDELNGIFGVPLNIEFVEDDAT